MTTDGHRAYLDAVEDAFGADIDYAQLVKVYGKLRSLRGSTRLACASVQRSVELRAPGPEAYQH